MKKTDVIIPINSKAQGDILQMAVVNSTKYGTQVIKLDDRFPSFILVPVESDEWVKVSIDERETIQMDPSYSRGLQSTFKYICYNITAEKSNNNIDPNCDYFTTCSTQLTNNNKIKKQRVLKTANKKESIINKNKVV